MLHHISTIASKAISTAVHHNYLLLVWTWNFRRVEERKKKWVASAAGVYLSVYLLKLVFSLLNSFFVVLFLSWLSKQTLSVKTQTGFYVLEIQLWNNLLGIYFKFCGLYNVFRVTLPVEYANHRSFLHLQYSCKWRWSAVRAACHHFVVG